MIDLMTEDVRSLADAVELLPRRRRGKRPHPGTLKRWAKEGCRGVFLEVIVVGDTMCTSIQALQRFFNRLTEIAGVERPIQQANNESEDSIEIETELDRHGL